MDLFWRELNYMIEADEKFMIEGLPFINILN